MKTDWQQIRDMMGTAIDACERIEATGFPPQDRAATIELAISRKNEAAR